MIIRAHAIRRSGPKVQAAVKDAIGGCLFIDEAYALCDGGGDSFSNEAICMLLTEVENNRTAMVVIMAGRVLIHPSYRWRWFIGVILCIIDGQNSMLYDKHPTTSTTLIVRCCAASYLFFQ